MAYADDHFDKTEEEVILKKMSRLFPKEDNQTIKYEQFKKDYKSLKSEDIDHMIKLNFDNFSHVSFSDKYRVYREMYDIINADGVIDESETEAMDKLKEIIDYEVKK
jgi:uncharacterized tellurite resistance protein B-like protein